jgi:hypothetical protein
MIFFSLILWPFYDVFMMNTPKKTIIVPASVAGQGAPGAAGVSRKKEPPVKIGVLLNFGVEKKGGMAVELLLVMDKKEGRSYQRIPLTGALYATYLPALPPPVAAVLRKLADSSLIECLVRGGYGWLRDVDKPFDNLDERHYVLLRQWVGEALQELKPLTPAIPLLFYIPPGQSFLHANVKPASISVATPSLQFVLEREFGYLRLRCSVLINNGVFPLDDFQRVPYFLKSGNEYFLLRKEDIAVLDDLASGALDGGAAACGALSCRYGCGDPCGGY